MHSLTNEVMLKNETNKKLFLDDVIKIITNGIISYARIGSHWTAIFLLFKLCLRPKTIKVLYIYIYIYIYIE